MKRPEKGNLYVVATPIGNLSDITLRAVETLRQADLIICEDTRSARKLLQKYEIKSVPRSYYAPREFEKASKYLDMACNGKDLALISESGTPVISDPGAEIVRRAHERGIRVFPVPGACAVVSALSVSGFCGDRFYFAGFIPSNRQRRKKFIKENFRAGETFIFYDSKRRIIDSLDMINEIYPESNVFVIREMTKIYEEYLRGGPLDIRKTLASRESIKGEFTVLCFR